MEAMAFANPRSARPAGWRVVSGDGQKSAISDEQLIEAVRAGDARLSSELYARLIDTVDRTLYRVFGRREQDHEDLIQRSFEQIVLTLMRGSFAGACSLRTWASSVTSRVAFNALRSRKRERGVFDRSLATDEGKNDVQPGVAVHRGATFEGQTLARAELERLRQALVKMNPARAEAVFLHDVLGHELAEITVMAGVSVAAAQSRLVRGRSDLYEALGCEASERGRGRK